MNPIIQQPGTREDLARWGRRGMEDFSGEELVQLHQKRARWIGPRARDPERPGRRPWVMTPNTAHLA
jgi:hypothetical protein